MLLEVEDLVLVQPALDDDRRQWIVAVLLSFTSIWWTAMPVIWRARAAPCARPASASAGRPATARAGCPATFVDEHVAVAVEDRAARRVEPQRPHPVVVRAGEVLVAGQHLQRPEAQEEHREDGERDEAEHRDAKASCGVSR